jgi:hypothetical protein
MLGKQQLKTLEKLGRLQFPIEECAIIINYPALQREINTDEVIKNTYERGRLKACVEVRQAILKQAINGSTPAQKQMIDLMSNKIDKKENFFYHKGKKYKKDNKFFSFEESS